VTSESAASKTLVFMFINWYANFPLTLVHNIHAFYHLLPAFSWERVFQKSIFVFGRNANCRIFSFLWNFSRQHLKNTSIFLAFHFKARKGLSNMKEMHSSTRYRVLPRKGFPAL